MEVMFRGHRCMVMAGTYNTGGTALWLKDAVDGTKIATATVDALRLPANEVVIKDYSENTGLLRVLEEAGIIELTGKWVRVGFSQCYVCRVLVELSQESL